MTMFPHGITVTVMRMVEDKFGGYTAGPTHQVGPCGFEATGGSGRPGSRERDTETSDTVTRIALLYMPPGADVRPTDRVILPDATTWQVVGDIATFSSPFTGWTPGTTVQLQRVTG